MEMVLEGMEENVSSNCNIYLKQDREEECRCRELKIICKESEEKCAVQEAEIQKSRKENEALERKIKLLEMEKLSLEEELKVLRDKNWECGQEKRSAIIDLTKESEEEDAIVQILIENNVLECEKKKAEDDTEVWKAKFKELESRFLNVDKTTRNGKDRREQPLDMEGGISTGFSPGTPPSTTLLIDRVAFGREKRGDLLQSQVQVRRQLKFKEETSPSKKITLSTPGSARPIFLGSVDATDSEDEPNINELSCRKVSLSTTKKAVNEVLSFEDIKSKQENGDASDQNLTFMTKRKRASRIVKSDTESDCEDDDDNIPISKLKRLHLCDTNSDQVSSELNGCSKCATTRKHRLRKASTGKDHGRGISSNEGVEDDDLEEVGLESEGESLDGFIVECSDASSNGDKDSNSEHSSEDFDEILSKIQRKKDKKLEWEFEADMLADFGKDPELCMKAVCALYRQQTSAEKIRKLAICSNKRGFSQVDAFRGSIIAEFLTGGDSHSDVVKSVDELREYDAEAVELCRKLATHYSKQLFEIYKEKVDPLFLPHPPSF